MQAANIIKKLREANLPPFVETTSLVAETQQRLRDIVQGKEYRVDGAYRSYIIQASKAIKTRLVSSAKPARIAAVLAKELILSGAPVYYQPLAGLLREVRLQDYSAEKSPLSPVLDFIGKGYIVVPDIDNAMAHPSESVWQDACDVLQSHVHRGGGLILAYSDDSAPLLEGTTQHFASLLATFQAVSV